jgi:signal transduction histidine kinase
MDRMTKSGNVSVLSVASPLRWLRANWPALLLPLLAVAALALIHGLQPDGPIRGAWPVLLIIAAILLAVLVPTASAKVAPFGLLAYGVFGIYLAHLLLAKFGGLQLYYGPVHVSGELRIFHFVSVSGSRSFERSGVDLAQVTPLIWRASSLDNAQAGLVLAEAVAFLAAGVWLLARTGAPGGGGLRRAMAQLRGTDGQPRTVPPLLLLPVLFLWEEMFSNALWFAGNYYGQNPAGPLMVAALIFAAGVAIVVWLPRAAAVLALAGLILFGLGGVLLSVHWLWAARLPLAALHWRAATMFYGAVQLAGGLDVQLRGEIGVPLPAGLSAVFGAAQGAVLLGLGCALLPRLLTWDADHRLARHAQELARRVEGLTRSRTDATDTAVAELRRIERDLHDGAQARLVAVGMSLRAAELLMLANPEAALALVAEARETSSRAIDDLRDLVRGIYPPVLADRGLADAVRALALDAVLEVSVDVDLPGEPPMPVAAAVYFAVAEALTNAARHAGACAVQVGVEHGDGMLRATITDDGHGGADAARGTGLAGVERRLATFDGILAVSSPAGGPTIVAIEVPCALSSVKISSC